jgi:arylsulfatase A-like enzyme
MQSMCVIYPTAIYPKAARCAALALVLIGACAGCAPDRPASPDVVLIDLESARPDHLSHAGYPRPTAVRLDEFRGRAALFVHARSPSSHSIAASASLLTGLSPDSLRRAGPGIGVVAGPPTLAEILRERGWHTVGLSHHPGIAAANGFDRGFDRFEAATGSVEAHPDAAVMVAWLREWLAGEPVAPVFLYLHPMNAGPPYRVPPDHREVLLGRRPSRRLPYGGERMRAAERSSGAGIAPAHVASLVEQYDTALRYTLDRVADLLNLLAQNDRLDAALVVITANHGEELFDHRGFGHGRTLHEEVLRVPLYVKLPGASSAATLDTPVSTLDVVPTVLDLLGMPAPAGDGRSLAPLLREPPVAPSERDFAHELGAPGDAGYQRALLRGRHKLIEVGGGEAAGAAPPVARLYDLVLDPHEENDLAAASPEVVERVRRELDRLLADR